MCSLMIKDIHVYSYRIHSIFVAGDALISSTKELDDWTASGPLHSHGNSPSYPEAFRFAGNISAGRNESSQQCAEFTMQH